MANKRLNEQRIRKEKELRFNKECAKLTVFPIIALIGMVAIMLLFLVDWANIYNTKIVGKEVSISGFNCLFSGLTGNYSSSDAIYGDMAIPFYYYAKSYCENLSILTLISAVIFLLLLVSQLVGIFTKKHILNIISAALGILLTIMLIACFVIALDMSNSKILSVYCGGNPACFIQSYAIIPAIVALIVAVVHGFAAYKYYSLQLLLK